MSHDLGQFTSAGHVARGGAVVRRDVRALAGEAPLAKVLLVEPESSSPSKRPMTNEALTGRLAGWKEIAAYLERSVRTAQRWESHYGLPVRRLQRADGATVLAFRRELDAWRDSPQGRQALSDVGVTHDVAASSYVGLLDLPGDDHGGRQARTQVPAGAVTPAAALAEDAASRRRRATYLGRMAAIAMLPLLALTGAIGLTQLQPGAVLPTLACPGDCVVRQGQTLKLQAHSVAPTDAFVRSITARSTGHVESFRPLLRPDEHGTVTWGFTTDCTSRAGTYDVRLVREGSTDETNAVRVRIEPEPSCLGPVADLVAEGVSVDLAAVTPGDWVRVRFALRNQGDQLAPSSVTRVRLGRSAERTPVTDRMLGDIAAPTLPVGAGVTLEGNIRVPEDVPPGSAYYIWVIADNGSAVIERAGANNFARSAPLAVQPRGPSASSHAFGR